MTPLREYGLIGDGHTAALVSRDGSIDWWRAPRFDSPPVFDALLGGPRRAAAWSRSAPESFAYEADTNALRATWRGGTQAWTFMPYPRRSSASTIVALDGDAARVIIPGTDARMPRAEAERALQRTLEASRDRAGEETPPAARRGLLALKLLTYGPTGAVVAAPTTSLPELLGGARNWDYRDVWIRDAAFCAQAYARWGKREEARRIAEWILTHVVAPERVSVLDAIDGSEAPDEREVALPGYAASRPVRVGNGAIRQFQLDAYGHVVETLDILHALDDGRLRDAWPLVVRLLDGMIARRDEDDNGIWEIPVGAGRRTYSKPMVWYALDRALRIAETHGLDAPDRWRVQRDGVRDEILARGTAAGDRAFVQAYETTAADASTLRIPLMGLVAPDPSGSLATLRLVRDELEGPHGLLRRDKTPDGLPGREGAFLACSFWLAQLQHAAGMEADARSTLTNVEAIAGELGLLREQVDPATGAFLGNHPQALSHAAHLCALAALQERTPRRRLEA